MEGTGVITLKVGYAHAKHDPPMRFRNPAEKAELVAHCNRESHIWFRSNDGTARQCKVNGKVREWKRDPNRIEIPVKYGLREYALFTLADRERVLIPL